MPVIELNVGACEPGYLEMKEEFLKSKCSQSGKEITRSDVNSLES